MIYIFGGAFDPPHVGHAAIIRALLHYRHPEKIILIPSSERDDKKYHVSDRDRLAMLEIFLSEIADERVIIDDFFIKNWYGEMITRDVDEYVRKKYGPDIIHVFGSDTIASMPEWDDEQYAAQVVRKLFVPRGEGVVVGEDFLAKISNYEFFTDSHIPCISSTEIRRIIPKYSDIRAFFENNPKFIIPGLSRQISQYILNNRLYRKIQNPKPKILVHVCCGPDVTMPILALRDEYEIICYWYDPNIQPKSEYDKRFLAFKKISEQEKIPFIKGTYDVGNFLMRIRGLEKTPEKGEKCTHCYDMRLYATAKLAKKLGIHFFTSSLNTSPKKDLEKIARIGHEYAKRFDLEFLDIPFRKRGGFEYSVEYTRKYGIYRQNYCGCIYSIREGGESELKRKMVG